LRPINELNYTHMNRILQWPIAVLISVMSFTSMAQTVRIADNNFNAPQGDNIFPTIQEAIDAASPGDIIYIQPSPTKYGSGSTDKQLIFKGVGFDLDKDIPHQSVITNLRLTNNNDNTSDASGTEIEGLIIDNIFLGISNGIDYVINDIIIKNCRVNSGIRNASSTYAAVDNLLIYDCYIRGFIDFNNTVSNSEFRNNVMLREITMGGSTLQHSFIITNNIFYSYLSKSSQGDNVIIQHNVFVGTKGSGRAFISMRDAIIANNIFYGSTPSTTAAGNSTSTSFQRNIFTSNLSYETGNDALPPAGGGVGNSGDDNIIGVTPAFANVPILNTFSFDHDFTLQTGSAAINAASDGSDIGISGGPYAWTSSNLQLNTTGLPTIQIFNTTSVISPGSDLSIRVKAKGN
ncbi:MAG: hypothetical protein AAFN93_10760, partial [Bacteroidota bacterium]